MHQIAYNHRKLATMLLASALLAMLSFGLASMTGRRIPLIAGFIFIVCAAVVAKGLLAGRPALRFDERSVTISTLTSSTTLQWSQIVDIRIETMALTMYGFIPAGRHEYIVFHVAGGMLGTKKVRVASKLLDSSRSLAEICAALSAARLGSAAPAAALAPAVEAADGVTDAQGSGSGFDPDAAIARYLARKAAEEAARPAPSPVHPQRPVFGRKRA